MDFIFDGKLSDNLKGTVAEWLKNKYFSLMNESPDDLFIEYVMIMIGNGKSMKEMSAEINELISDEAKSRDFAESLGAELKKLTTSKIIESTMSKDEGIDIQTNEMTSKTSKRETINKSNRLLQNALKSTAVNVSLLTPSKATDNPNKDVKRKVITINQTNNTVKNNETNKILNDSTSISTSTTMNVQKKNTPNNEDNRIKSLYSELKTSRFGMNTTAGNTNTNSEDSSVPIQDNVNKKKRQRTVEYDTNITTSDTQIMSNKRKIIKNKGKLNALSTDNNEESGEVSTGNTEKYMKQIQQMATMMGFKTVEEMLVMQQQTMMAMLSMNQNTNNPMNSHISGFPMNINTFPRGPRPPRPNHHHNAHIPYPHQESSPRPHIYKNKSFINPTTSASTNSNSVITEINDTTQLTQSSSSSAKQSSSTLQAGVLSASITNGGDESETLLPTNSPFAYQSHNHIAIMSTPTGSYRGRGRGGGYATHPRGGGYHSGGRGRGWNTFQASNTTTTNSSSSNTMTPTLSDIISTAENLQVSTNTEGMQSSQVHVPSGQQEVSNTLPSTTHITPSNMSYSQPSYRGGRGGGGGGRFAGRGPPISGRHYPPRPVYGSNTAPITNKKWVREASIEDSLTSNR